jgi:hypothetical protein
MLHAMRLSVRMVLLLLLLLLLHMWFAADHRPHHPPLIWSGRKLSDLICRMGFSGASVPLSASGSSPRRCLQHKPLSSTRCATSSEPLRSHMMLQVACTTPVHATHDSYKSFDTSASLPALLLHNQPSSPCRCVRGGSDTAERVHGGCRRRLPAPACAHAHLASHAHVLQLSLRR